MGYKPTENIDQYHQLQGTPQDDLLLTTDQINQHDAIQQQKQDELTGETTVSTTENKPEEPKKEEESKPFVSGRDKAGSEADQEAMTAVIGAGIDLVEGVGSTAELIWKRKWLDAEYKPTWLQVNDDVEPMNKTVWGKFMRFGLELGLGFATTGGVSHLAKASKIPLVTSLGRYLVDPKTTKAGRFGQEATKSAIVTFSNSHAEEGNLSDLIGEVMPWLPNPLKSSENATPLERRAKAVLEDAGLAGLVAKFSGYLAGVKWSKILDSASGNTMPKGNPVKLAEELEQLKINYADMVPDSPEAKAAVIKLEKLQNKVDDFLDNNPDVKAAKAEEAASFQQQRAIDEDIQLQLELDPEISKPNPSLHPDYFDEAEKGIRTVESDSVYENLLDAMKMEKDGWAAGGRRARLITNANIKRIVTGRGTNVQRMVKALAGEVQEGLERPLGQNIGGLGVSLKQAKELAVARYVDAISRFGEMQSISREGFGELRDFLMEEGITIQKLTGGETTSPNAVNAITLEMLTSDLAAAVSDKATALLTVKDKVPIENALQQNLDNFEALLLMNQEASEFAGSLLRSRNWSPSTNRLAKAAKHVDKQQQIKTFVKNFTDMVKKDPQMADAALRAFAESNGNAVTLQAIADYANEAVFNWKSLIFAGIGKEKAKSRLVEGIFQTLYNSILGAPKTLMRAFTGTGLLTVMRPLETTIGSVITGDKRTFAMGMHQMHSTLEAVSEAWQLAKNTDYSYIRDGKHGALNNLFSPAEEQNWKSLGAVIESTGTTAEKARYRFASMLMDFNNNAFVRYPAELMGKTDVFFKTIVGRQELKRKAFEKAFDATDGVVDKKLIMKYEDELRSSVFSPDGEVIDAAAEFAGKEVALQIPLDGVMAGVQNTLETFPLLKPFFLFPKTSANAIGTVAKRTPILNQFNQQVKSILNATPDNLDDVMKYGIQDAQQLAAAKAMVRGRIATGYMTVFAAAGVYMSGRLTGNGPADVQTRNAWRQVGNWQPRSIKFGDRWISYDSLEPFSSILAMVADIGDNASLMSEAMTEEWLRKVGYLISMNLTNKSFLSGLKPLSDILALDGERGEVWAANMVNSFLPFSAVRNEIANVFNPGRRELEYEFLDVIANRNPIARGSLPLQHNILNGEIVSDWSFPQRVFNSVMPVQIGTKDSPVAKLIRDSGFDIVTTMNTDSLGVRLDNEARSEMQRLIGEQNIEKEIAKLLNNKQIKDELNYYRKQRLKQVPGNSPEQLNNLDISDSLTHRALRRIFSNAKKVAEAQMHQNNPQLKQSGVLKQALKRAQRGGNTERIDNILQMMNK